MKYYVKNIYFGVFVVIIDCIFGRQIMPFWNFFQTSFYLKYNSKIIWNNARIPGIACL